MTLSRRHSLLAVLLLATLSCGGSEADLSASEDAIENAPALVSPGIFRSSRPGYYDLAALKRTQGLKFILDLENDESAVSSERRNAQNLGIAFISEPMSGFWAPSDRQVDRILAILADPTKRPILVHCKHGEDRTGLIVALHRVENEGWTASRAYREMIDKGFHRSLWFLNHYFEERTGYDP